MNKQEKIKALEIALAVLKGESKSKKVVNGNIGLSYWSSKTGYTVLKDNLKYTAKTGKVYNAKEISIEDNITKKPKTFLIKSVKGGSQWTSKNF